MRYTSPYVYLNETLTAGNHQLLKGARTEAKKNFKFKGYTVNGQVPVSSLCVRIKW